MEKHFLVKLTQMGIVEGQFEMNHTNYDFKLANDLEKFILKMDMKENH